MLNPLALSLHFADVALGIGEQIAASVGGAGTGAGATVLVSTVLPLLVDLERRLGWAAECAEVLGSLGSSSAPGSAALDELHARALVLADRARRSRKSAMLLVASRE